jgi:glycosyltransferase involved in cell wall biosynthesis
MTAHTRLLRFALQRGRPLGSLVHRSLSLALPCCDEHRDKHIKGSEATSNLPPPPQRLSEADIRHSWRGDRPVVSVLCPTYQHVQFVGDALDGFLGQRTSFPFEVILRDDASTDGTAEVLRSVASEYPSIVKLILEPANTWGRVHFLKPLLEAASGEFIAICAGDDYWVNPNKLERQVEILRGDETLVGTYHDLLHFRDGVVTRAATNGPARRVSGRKMLRGQGPSIQTLLYRRWEDDALPYLARVTTEDVFLRARLGRLGDFLYVSDAGPTAYRIHDASLWSSKRTEDRAPELATSLFWIAAYFADAGDKATARHFLRLSAEAIVRSHIHRGVDPRFALWLHLPWWAIRSITGRLFRWLFRG